MICDGTVLSERARDEATLALAEERNKISKLKELDTILTNEITNYEKILVEDKAWFALNIERIKRYGEPPVDQTYANEDATTSATMPLNYDLNIEPPPGLVQDVSLFALNAEDPRAAGQHTNADAYLKTMTTLCHQQSDLKLHARLT